MELFANEKVELGGSVFIKPARAGRQLSLSPGRRVLVRFET